MSEDQLYVDHKLGRIRSTVQKTLNVSAIDTFSTGSICEAARCKMRIHGHQVQRHDPQRHHGARERPCTVRRVELGQVMPRYTLLRTASPPPLPLFSRSHFLSLSRSHSLGEVSAARPFAPVVKRARARRQEGNGYETRIPPRDS